LPRFVKRLRVTSKRARRAAVERARGSVEDVAAGLDRFEVGCPVGLPLEEAPGVEGPSDACAVGDAGAPAGVLPAADAIVDRGTAVVCPGRFGAEGGGGGEEGLGGGGGGGGSGGGGGGGGSVVGGGGGNVTAVVVGGGGGNVTAVVVGTVTVTVTVVGSVGTDTLGSETVVVGTAAVAEPART
jgi:hypothetical protein